VGDFDTATKALAQALQAAPAWVQVYVRLAQMTVVLHQPQNAMQYADIARGLAPDDPNVLTIDTFVNAAAANPGQTDQIDKTLALLAELKRRFADRSTPGDRQDIAMQLSRLGKTDEAIQLLAAATPPALATQVSTAPSTQALASTRPAGDTFLLARLYAK